MKPVLQLLLLFPGMFASSLALAAGGDLGQVDKQPTNWVAIGMFAAFVLIPNPGIEEGKTTDGHR